MLISSSKLRHVTKIATEANHNGPSLASSLFHQTEENEYGLRYGCERQGLPDNCDFRSKQLLTRAYSNGTGSGE
jgi:hypothetical protein